MAFTLRRLFVKKRGTRRTGARWPGLLGEGALFTSLLAIGVYALYWLIVRVLLNEQSAYGWWPWLAMVIPLGLIVVGATNLVLLFWHSTASTERRAAVAAKATGWELPGAQSRPPRPSLPTVPAVDAVSDSPGVRLAYRLPIDAASGWVSFTMATVCLVWNTLVAIFVLQIIQQHVAGRPNWLLTWLMVPFVLAGLWTMFALGRQILLNIAIGPTCVEVSSHPLFPGGTFRGFVSQSGRLHIRWLQVQLVCEEQAVYQQGTDTRRGTNRVYRDTLFSQRKFDITPDQIFQTEFEFKVPPSAMHSFVSPHNAIVWTLVVRGRMARWGDFERRFPVFVYPINVAPVPAANPFVAAAQGWR
jgi:hypothetical protein